MHKIKRLLITSLLFSGITCAAENKNIRITDAWISEAPPTISTLAAYATLQNKSGKAVMLRSIASPEFAHVELHLSKIVADLARMEKQDSLLIPANDSVALSPGGYHLMLFNPKRPLTAGDTATIIFTFADDTSKTVTATVKKRNTQAHDHSHHQHQH